MSRPIILTDEIKNEIQEEFCVALNNTKMTDGKFSYSKNFKYNSGNATVLLSPEAYRKIVTLVTEFSDEVAWHGTVSRINDSEFVIEDIFVYPQEVTGGTVNTDQEEYTKWLYGQDDEVFDKIRMQGHSHVNMGVSPSQVDNTHRQQILEQLEENMFYIFMIWNKSLQIHTLIYDMARNILYEDKDVDVKILTNDGMDDFLSDAKGKVRKHVAKKSVMKIPVRKSHKQQEFDSDLAEYGYFPHSESIIYDPLGGNIWGI